MRWRGSVGLRLPAWRNAASAVVKAMPLVALSSSHAAKTAGEGDREAAEGVLPQSRGVGNVVALRVSPPSAALTGAAVKRRGMTGKPHLPHKVAGGGPPAEERVVEGAGHMRRALETVRVSYAFRPIPDCNSSFTA